MTSWPWSPTARHRAGHTPLDAGQIGDVRLSDIERRARMERLFEQHYPAVLAYALRRAPSAVAEDIASETFVVVSRRLEDIPIDALPWLYGVARRVLANERRGAARRDRLTRELQHDAEPVWVDTEHSDARNVLTALAQLPSPDREALMLTAWEGLTSAEAATVVGCSAIAMRARLSRARRRLAHLLASDQHTPTKASSTSRTPTGDANCGVIERSK